MFRSSWKNLELDNRDKQEHLVLASVPIHNQTTRTGRGVELQYKRAE